MGRLIPRLRSAAFRKGMIGTSRGWLGVWAVLTAAKGIQRLAREKPIVDRIALKPGQTLEVRDTGVSVEKYDAGPAIVKVLLRNPRREMELSGPISVIALLQRLEVNRESVLVICGDTLVPGDATLADDAIVEIRPVISGG